MHVHERKAIAHEEGAALVSYIHQLGDPIFELCRESDLLGRILFLQETIEGRDDVSIDLRQASLEPDRVTFRRHCTHVVSPETRMRSELWIRWQKRVVWIDVLELWYVSMAQEGLRNGSHIPSRRCSRMSPSHRV